MLIKQQKKENLSLLSKNKIYYIQKRPKHTVATKKVSDDNQNDCASHAHWFYSSMLLLACSNTKNWIIHRNGIILFLLRILTHLSFNSVSCNNKSSELWKTKLWTITSSRLTLVLDHWLYEASVCLYSSNKPSNKVFLTAPTAGSNRHKLNTLSRERFTTHSPRILLSFFYINQERTKSGDSKWANFHMQSVLIMRQLKRVDWMNHRAEI